MADLIGRQMSITFSGITTPTNGFVVGYEFAMHEHDGTRFGDIHDRVTKGTGRGVVEVECFIDTTATPALTELQTGTGAVLTLKLDNSASHQYVITNAHLLSMRGGARANAGSPPQTIRYRFAVTIVSSATQPVIAT